MNWLVYAALVEGLHWGITASNAAAWIAAVAFAYIANKVWVFRSFDWSPAFVLREAILFVSARILTGILEIGAVPLLVKLGLNQTLFGVTGMWAKVLVSVAVVILNYVFLGILMIHSIGLVVNLFTGFYYYFDELNVYHRANGYSLSNVMHIIMLVQNAFLLIKYRKKFDKRLASALWIYLIAPLGAIALQLFFQEIQFIIIITVIAAAYLYFVITRIQLERYENQQKEKERLDTELTMATRIQAETLPNIFPAFPERDDFNIHASMNPAKEVGGDFYDFFLIDDTHLGLVMADVSGKGVPAALFMMVSKILIQNIAMMGNRPAEVLRFVNNQLCMDNHEDMFVTVWYGCLDLETGVLEAANAGHEYPIFKYPDGRFELIKDKHGLVIGAMEGAKYRSYELHMEPGSKLFLYTDGVPEATNANNELFGTDRLVQALREKETGTPKEILAHVDSVVKDFVKDAPQFDDLTMLCIEYIGPGN